MRDEKFLSPKSTKVGVFNPSSAASWKRCRLTDHRGECQSFHIPLQCTHVFWAISVPPSLTFSGYISQTSVTVRKYCRQSEGNLSSSSVISGITMFRPNRHTSAALKGCCCCWSPAPPSDFESGSEWE